MQSWKKFWGVEDEDIGKTLLTRIIVPRRNVLSQLYPDLEFVLLVTPQLNLYLSRKKCPLFYGTDTCHFLSYTNVPTGII